MKTGIELIAQERKEQVEKHDWNNDSEHDEGELVQAAIFCLTEKEQDYPKWWGDWFLEKVKAKKERMTEVEYNIEMLKIAGAFCAAEIDRLNNLKLN